MSSWITPQQSTRFEVSIVHMMLLCDYILLLIVEHTIDTLLGQLIFRQKLTLREFTSQITKLHRSITVQRHNAFLLEVTRSAQIGRWNTKNYQRMSNIEYKGSFFTRITPARYFCSQKLTSLNNFWTDEDRENVSTVKFSTDHFQLG
jgi:hypothetical protein